MNECIHCDGKGWNMERGPDGFTPEKYECSECNGTGKNKMNAPINDGGPAFPCESYGLRNGKETTIPAQGMTLRDYFAAKALAGMLADAARNGAIELYAQNAYQFADAMLAARGSGNTHRCVNPSKDCIK